MCKITTLEVDKELHLKVSELARASGMKVKKLVAYLLEEGMKRFREDYAGLVKEDLPTEGLIPK